MTISLLTLFTFIFGLIILLLLFAFFIREEGKDEQNTSNNSK
jgi:hypothetical protein